MKSGIRNNEINTEERKKLGRKEREMKVGRKEGMNKEKVKKKGREKTNEDRN